MEKLNKEYLLKRSLLIKKLRKNAAWLQVFALIFLCGGLGLNLWTKINKFSNLYLTVLIIAFLLIGVVLEIVALIYFNKAKKHLSGQIVQASTNPKHWR